MTSPVDTDTVALLATRAARRATFGTVAVAAMLFFILVLGRAVGLFVGAIGIFLVAVGPGRALVGQWERSRALRRRLAVSRKEERGP